MDPHSPSPTPLIAHPGPFHVLTLLYRPMYIPYHIPHRIPLPTQPSTAPPHPYQPHNIYIFQCVLSLRPTTNVIVLKTRSLILHQNFSKHAGRIPSSSADPSPVRTLHYVKLRRRHPVDPQPNIISTMLSHYIHWLTPCPFGSPEPTLS